MDLSSFKPGRCPMPGCGPTADLTGPTEGQATLPGKCPQNSPAGESDKTGDQQQSRMTPPDNQQAVLTSVKMQGTEYTQLQKAEEGCPHRLSPPRTHGTLGICGDPVPQVAYSFVSSTQIDPQLAVQRPLDCGPIPGTPGVNLRLSQEQYGTQVPWPGYHFKPAA